MRFYFRNLLQTFLGASTDILLYQIHRINNFIYILQSIFFKDRNVNRLRLLSLFHHFHFLFHSILRISHIYFTDVYGVWNNLASYSFEIVYIKIDILSISMHIIRIKKVTFEAAHHTKNLNVSLSWLSTLFSGEKDNIIPANIQKRKRVIVLSKHSFIVWFVDHMSTNKFQNDTKKYCFV